jgi:hypothetical protein
VALSPNLHEEEIAQAPILQDSNPDKCCGIQEPTELKIEIDDGTPGPAHTLSGSLLGRADLRREQQEKLESKHHANQATRREVIPITDVRSTALGREEMVEHL